MLMYAVLLLAVVSRFLPHILHATAWNFTMIGGGLLFFGSRMGGEGKLLGFAKMASAVAVLAAADFYLTVFVYQFPFHISSYLVTWLWYAAVCLIGMGLLEKPSVLRVIAGVVASSTSFFLLSNFAVWAGSVMYPHTQAGLLACYGAAIPFYRNDVVSTALTAGVLFGLPVFVAKLVESMDGAHHNQPLA